MSKNKKINIVTIGGGNGSHGLLSALKNEDDLNISAIISMSDSGGSTGILKDEFDILPPGDVRRAIIALSKEHEPVKNLFDYRYSKDSSVSGHSLGNLIITAMVKMAGSFDRGLKQVSRMFKVKGRVIPVTLEKSCLCAKLEDGQIIKGENNIDMPKHNINLKIKKLFLEKPVQANPKAIKAIKKADMIIISFGDLYTSLIPNLLVNDINETIKQNKKAKVVYLCNLMTKPGETTSFEAFDFISTLEKYLGKNIVDFFVVNNGYISDKMAEKYKSLENKKPVKVKHHKFFRGKGYKVIESDMLHENTFVRHSYDKILKCIRQIISEAKIKKI